MNTNLATISSRLILLGVMLVASLPTLKPALAISDSCGGPVIYLSGTTASRYSDDTVADGTLYNRTGWYSDAVGNGTGTAFYVGNGAPPPQDVCAFGGVINGHIPLNWTWEETHDFGGSGDKTYTGRLALIDGARVHNVEDGWDPRELPEFGNTGVILMRNAYMTGIRDDSIENDNFMPGSIEDSLFDGVHTFLSEQNQSGGTPVTIGPDEDRYIRVTRVYVRLHSTNSNGSDNPGRWFKWQARGTTNHNLIITDSVFATHGPSPRDGWDSLEFPAGTTFEGTNYVLWLGTPGGYEAAVPSEVIFLEGQAAFDKWNEVRNAWLTAHGYAPKPPNDFNPMDDAVMAPSSIRFAVIGDYGESSQPELDVANRVKSWNPDFIITTGDNNYPDGAASTIDANIGQYYHAFIHPYTGSYGAGATVNRFFPSLGNHDWHAPNAQPYLDYFTLPGNERYYDYIRGPAHFFVIDSDDSEPDGNDDSSTQAAWLQGKLAASTSPWNIVYMHHSPYSSSSKHGSSSTLQWPFAAWGADAVLSGHDHTYERIFQNGIPYFVNGLGGRSSIYSFGAPIPGSQVRYNGDYGAMLVEANEQQINFRFITRTGALIDSYTLSNNLSRRFNSTGANDGWVLESTETSDVGGSKNNLAATLRLGDNSADRQFRSILSFNTSGLPDNAVIASVTLKFKYAGVSGVNPFDTHGNLLADIREGAFKGNAALQPGDFNAAASKDAVLTFSNVLIGNWYSQAFDPADFQYINLTGVTQFRLRFSADDNDDSSADLLKIYSGNAGAANRPRLIIEYHLP